jgi:hypothetical protein
MHLMVPPELRIPKPSAALEHSEKLLDCFLTVWKTKADVDHECLPKLQMRMAAFAHLQLELMVL